MRRAENASPMQAAEEPPNLKNPNQRWRKLSPYCLGFLLGSAFKNRVLGLLVVDESQTEKPLIKSGFMVRNLPLENCPKVPTHEPRPV